MPWQHPDSHLPGHYLQQYTIDLTALAAENKLDPVIGREDEIRRCLQILARRTKVSTKSPVQFTTQMLNSNIRLKMWFLTCFYILDNFDLM
jgi:hypothetical protein